MADAEQTATERARQAEADRIAKNMLAAAGRHARRVQTAKSTPTPCKETDHA